MQRFEQEILGTSRNACRQQTLYGYCFDLSFEVGLGLGLPRSVPSQHFIENDSNRPNVALRTVVVII